MSQQINLFNPIFLKKKKYFSAVTMVQALGIILVGAAAVSGYAKYQVSALEKEAVATSAQLASMQAKFKKISAEYGPKQKSQALENEVQRAELELKSLQKVFALLERGNFGDTSGYAEYMRAFARQTVNGVWLTGFNIQGAGSDISLQGRALRPELVPAYITRLKNEPSLQGKSFAAFEMQMPSSNQVTKTNPAMNPATYIDFRLQSSIAVAEQTKEEPLTALAGGLK